MSGFSAEWLSLREPIDHAARNETVVQKLQEHFSDKDQILITDIACGTGSTIRALEPRLSNDIAWTLIDNDPLLLEEARKQSKSDHVTLDELDLSLSLETICDHPTDLISTSAFLDLVSESWIRDLIYVLKKIDKPFYAALTYDGRAGYSPPVEGDTDILTAFNKHQRKNKGFGKALGPDAAETAIGLFKEAGFLVTSGLSDWKANGDHPGFQKMLLEGWHEAAREIEPLKENLFNGWREERLSLIEEGKSSVLVGHVDFLAIPGA